MELDYKLELEGGQVHFKGEITDEERDHIMKVGLVVMFLRGDIKASYVSENGSIINDMPNTVQ